MKIMMAKSESPQRRALTERAEQPSIPTSVYMFDTHAHLDISPLDSDIEGLLSRCRSGIFPQGVTQPAENLRMHGILMPGISVASSERVVRLAQNDDLLFAGVAIHPNSCKDVSESDWIRIEELAAFPRVVAIGETGLDRYWDDTPFDVQKEFFQRHINLARKRQLPILIHCRDAFEDLMPILRKESETPGLFGVIHAFSGDAKLALECVSLGFHISFACAITYTNKKFDALKEAAKAVPLDRMLLETDSPYIVPHPYRGKIAANEPLLVAFAAKAIADLRECSIDEILKQTTKNANSLFCVEGLLL